MKRAPYLNPDAFCRFIGPKNLGKALVDDELVTCLLDNGVQLNFITPTVMMNVKVPGIAGYDEDQIAIVMDDPGMTEWPVILGTPTIYRVMEVIKESEISKLVVPWASSRVSWLMRDVVAKLGQVMVNDIANKPIMPLHVDEVVRVASKCTVPPSGHKVRSISFCMVTR